MTFFFLGLFSCFNFTEYKFKVESSGTLNDLAQYSILLVIIFFFVIYNYQPMLLSLMLISVSRQWRLVHLRLKTYIQTIPS